MLPLELRQKMFYRTLELYAQGLGLRKIHKKLREEFGATVSRSTLSYWLRGLKAPYRSKPKLQETTQKIELQPCPELEGDEILSEEIGTIPIPAPGDGPEELGSPHGREPPALWGRRADEGASSSPQRGRGRKFLPIELRRMMFNDVLKLRNEGLTYKKIIMELQMKYGTSPSMTTISFWTRGIHSPHSPRSVELEPSPELSYIIGAIIGDGYTSRTHYSTKVILKVKDEDFARESVRCLAVLGIRANVRFLEDQKMFKVTAYSVALYEIVKKPVDIGRLKKYVEHCDSCTAAFLRGFADAEGSVDKKDKKIAIYNSNLRVLGYTKELFGRLGIEVTGPRLAVPARRFRSPRTGKEYWGKPIYAIYINTSSFQRFREVVGFAIRRKQERLQR